MTYYRFIVLSAELVNALNYVPVIHGCFRTKANSVKGLIESSAETKAIL